MKRYIASGLGAAGLLAASSAGLGAGRVVDFERLPAGTRATLDRYPGLLVYAESENRVTALYGTPMTAADTPEAAVTAWLAENPGAFGVANLHLEPVRADDLSFGKSTVFVYDQFLGGLPVESGTVRLLVLNGDLDSVVYAGARLADLPKGGFGADRVTQAQAVLSIATRGEYKDLSVWTDAELVVFSGAGELTPPIEPVRAWKFLGYNPDKSHQRGYTFFVDAATGGLVHARNEVHHIDITGTVTGKASPGLLPDIASNPAAFQPVENISLRIMGHRTWSNEAGMFLIPWGGTGPVQLQASTQFGRWVTVLNEAGLEHTVSRTITPPGPAILQLNAQVHPATTAQVNAFIHTNKIHDYIADRAPTFTPINLVTPAYVNLNQTCNAFFFGGDLSINFFSAGGGCVNTAYSTVVAHEYGHFIVNRLELMQQAFGEGFSDTVAMLLYDTPVVGANFQQSGGPVRNPQEANLQYPCDVNMFGIHYCGQVLGGLWWDIREAFGALYGSATGLSRTQQLQVDWAMLTMGPDMEGQAAHPMTAIEVLTADDDDGDLRNVTPHYEVICDAFSAHSIECPDLLQFQFPGGIPRIIPPDQTTTLRVNVIQAAGRPVAGSAVMFHRMGMGAFPSLPFQMAALAPAGPPNQYLATLPAAPCGWTVEYFFRATNEGDVFVFGPDAAPGEGFESIAAIIESIEVSDALEEDSGWTVGSPFDNATSGIWERTDPEATAAQPENDHTEAGSDCFVTDGRAGAGVGSFDVDAGQTTLTTPAIDLAGVPEARISYWRWYSNNQGETGQSADTFIIDVSNNNGLTWHRVETVGPAGDEAVGGTWFQHEFRVGKLVPLTGQVKLRFIASDLGEGSIIEAAIDDLTVFGYLCCQADFNGDGAVTVQDFLAYLSAYDAGEGRADFNNDGNVNVQDFLAFLSAYASGC